MSNIQITENASGKYSPEWFYSESQTPEWISFAHKADELRENFINLFGIERLKSLSGKDLLTSLFYNDEGTKTNLCYILEMDKDIREVFGSISGGAAYKFGLFYHKKNQSWTCGSPLKPVLLTEAEAIQKADEMRNDLVEGAEIISSFGPLDSEEDYEQLYKQLEHIPGINMVWRMKYYQMLFPALFAPFYGQDIQLRVLHFLNQKPSDIPFIRMGQISLYARKCNVPGVVFAHIYGKNVGYTNETNDSDTNTLSDKKHKTHYWMYTVFDDKSWNTQFAFRTLRVSANESRKILNSLLTMPEFPSFIRSLSSISYEFQDKQISSLKKLENEIGTARLKTALDWDKILDPIYTGAEPSKLELQDVFLLREAMEKDYESQSKMVQNRQLAKYQVIKDFQTIIDHLYPD